MELHHLRCVVAIADHGTFTNAATALHVSQPALSRAIAATERELGTRLFDRTASGAIVTAAGRALLDHARRAIVEAQDGKAAVYAVTGLLRGELRLAGIRTAVVETAQLAAAFHRHHPEVRITLDDPAGPEGVVDRVRTGRCDLGLLRTAEVPGDLPAVHACVQGIAAIFPEAIAPASDTVTMQQLSAYPIIAPLPDTPGRVAHDALFQGIPLQIVAECSHRETYVELVRGGVGAVLTSDSVAAAVDTTGISIHTLHPQTAIDLSVVSRQAPSPAATAFKDDLRCLRDRTTRNNGSSD